MKELIESTTQRAFLKAFIGSAITTPVRFIFPLIYTEWHPEEYACQPQ
jgi:hypothetical protein